ncbi:Rv3235 family protein [Actinokineospora pegani]|uniref:Rv3235 family protein n=1 Tax=Actinokineospora pegani TaxID=2654637 RepID=UPI0012EAD536|nr:Rv3235 family protein [Actinokineospora pegani]
MSILPDIIEPEPAWSTPPPSPPRPVEALRRGPVPTRDEPGPTRDTLWRLLALVLEVLDGKRAPGQLRAAVDAGVYEALLTRARKSRGRRHRLLSLHTCAVVPGVVELCASVRVEGPGGWRVQAFAGRMEAVEGQWRCVLLRPLINGPGRPVGPVTSINARRG